MQDATAVGATPVVAPTASASDIAPGRSAAWRSTRGIVPATGIGRRGAIAYIRRRALAARPLRRDPLGVGRREPRVAAGAAGGGRARDGREAAAGGDRRGRDGLRRLAA